MQVQFTNLKVLIKCIQFLTSPAYVAECRKFEKAYLKTKKEKIEFWNRQYFGLLKS